MTNEIYTNDELLKQVFSSNAVSIWDNQKGPVFWYAAGVPGPFYVNTEKLLGEDAAGSLLGQISNIVQKVGSIEEKSESLFSAVMEEYGRNPVFQRIIATLIDSSKIFDGQDYSCISGGERRDWFFSIPFAQETGRDHLFIFKDKSVLRRGFDGETIQAGPNVMHVSDLIHNAASYFDKWLPVLKENDLNVVGTLSVINRGNAGLDKLNEAGFKSLTLKGIDLDFFKELQESGLIDADTFAELDLYFESREEWAKKYILSNPELFDVAALDAKSKERLQFFVTEDPWGLEADAGDTFTALRSSLGVSKKNRLTM